MTMPSATGSAPPERPVPAPRATNGMPLACADPDDPLHLRGRAGEDDELRHRAPAREPVAVVDAELLGLADHVVGADDGLELGAERRRRAASARVYSAPGTALNQ